MKKNKVPDHLLLQAQIDYLYWILKKMLEKEKKLSPIEKMIDVSSGYNKKKIKDAKNIIKKIEKLKKDFYACIK